MELSIIILHHNTPKAVARLLYSLEKAILPEQTEILVLDNGGKNANEPLKETFNTLPITWCNIPNTGFPAGQNEGLKKSTGKYIAVINPDIQLDKDCINQLLEHIKAQPACGIATAVLQYPSGTIQDHARQFPTMWQIISRRLIPIAKAPTVELKEDTQFEPIDWCTGALWVMRREDIMQIRKHDERYFLFMSDIVLCRDMWEHNKRVDIVKAARATHEEKRLSSGNPIKMLFKKTGRIHMKDALLYFKHYWQKPLPINCPSNTSN